MGTASSKTRLFDGFAAVGKALSSGRRLELLDVLAQGPRSVERLAGEIGQSVANTSAHLQVLLAGGLVSTERDGNRVVYALAGPAVEGLWAALRATTQAHAAAMDRLAVDYLGDRSELETITRAQTRGAVGQTRHRWCSMSAPRPSSWPAMSRARSRSRPTSWPAGCGAFPS